MDETAKTDPLGGVGSSLSSQADVELRVQPLPQPCSLPIVLGSSSGYRRRIMDSLGWEFSTASPDVDEKAIRDPDPRKMCAEIARAKAKALAERLDKPAVLITADQAKAFLLSYSCRSVKTLSALCVTNLDTGRAAEGVHESTVSWREISPAVVDDVIASGNVMGSAGGFALEEPGLRSLVDKIEGSVDSVLGLPVDLLCTLIERATA